MAQNHAKYITQLFKLIAVSITNVQCYFPIIEIPTTSTCICTMCCNGSRE